MRGGAWSILVLAVLGGAARTAHALPDLRVVALSVPATAATSDRFPYEVTLRNDGDAETTAGLSVGIVLTTGTVALGDFDDDVAVNAGLAPGDSVELFNRAFVEPLPGTYNVLAVADAFEDVDERDETNNTFVSTAPIRIVTPVADMVVVQVLGPSMASRGDTVEMTVTVANAGTGPPFFTSELTVSISTDSRIDEEDRLIIFGREVPALQPGEEFTDVLCCVPLPRDLPAGDYFLGALADGNEHLGEIDETNNASTAPVRITLIDPPLDFAVLDASGPAAGRVGDAVSVVATVSVTGQAGASAPLEVRAHLARGRPATVDDPFIAAVLLPALAAPVTTQVILEGEIASTLPPGEYTVTVLADPFGVTGEISEDNNTFDLSGPLLVQGPNVDLTVGDVELPRTLFLGHPFTGSAEVTNEGTGRTRVDLALSMHVAQGRPAGPEDTFVAEGYLAGIEAGASAGVEMEGAVPADLAPGTYEYTLVVDPFEDVVETSEANNATSGTLSLVSSPFDLEVTGVTAPRTVAPGGGGAMFADVTNRGTQDVSSFHLGFLLTRTPSTDAPALDLYQVPRIEGGVAAGETRRTGPFFIGFPEDLATGDHHVLALADAYGEVPESDESNNAFVSAIPTAVVTEPPDDHPDTVDQAALPDDGLDPAGTPLPANHERAGDVDVFLLQAAAGDLMVLETLLGAGSSDDTVITLLAPDGTVLEENDNFGATLASRIGPRLAETSGTYAVTVRQRETLARGPYAVRGLARAGRPDLSVAVTEPSSASVLQGGRFQTTVTVTNDGQILASGGSVVGTYLSTDTVVTTADVLLSRFPLPDILPGARVRRTVRPLVDGFRVAPGTYFVGSRIDDGGRLLQSRTDNDAATAPARLTVLAASDDHPGTARLTDLQRDGLVRDGPAVRAALEQPGDEDFFRFPMRLFEELSLEVTPLSAGPLLVTVYQFSEDNPTGEEETPEGGGPARVLFEANNSGTGFARIRGLGPGQTGTYSVRLTRAPTGSVDDLPSSTGEFLPRLEMTYPSEGRIGIDGDVDFFEIRLQKDVGYRIRVTPESIAGVDVRLFPPGGGPAVRAGSSPFDGAPVEFTYTPSVTGAYPIRVAGRNAAERGTWLLAFGYATPPRFRITNVAEGDVLRSTLSVSGLPSALSALQTFVERRGDFLALSGSVTRGPAAEGLRVAIEDDRLGGVTRVSLTPERALSRTRSPRDGDLFTLNYIRLAETASEPLPPASVVVAQVELETAFGDRSFFFQPESDAGFGRNVLASFDSDGTLLPTIPDFNPQGGSEGARRAHIRLDGRLSVDPNVFPGELTYRWFVLGSPAPVTLSDDRSSVPTFAPTTAGLYTFGLVAESGLPGFLDDVDILVGLAGRSPSAVAVARDLESGASTGPTTPLLVLSSPGKTIELDGTGSFDPNGGGSSTLDFSWFQEDGPEVSLSPGGDDPRPRVVLDRPGRYEFGLSVTDPEELESPVAPVKVLVLDPDNTLPRLSLRATASSTGLVGGAIPQDGETGLLPSLRVTLPTTVVLTAEITDPDVSGPDEQQIRVTWRQVLGPRVALSVTGDDPGFSLVSRTAFTPTTARVHEFLCRVREVDSDEDPTGVVVDRRIRVIVDSRRNRVPEARVAATVGAAAGHPSGDERLKSDDPRGRGTSSLAAPAGSEVTLSGAGSRDLGSGSGTVVAYNWVQVQGPTVELSSPFSALTTFRGPSVSTDLAVVFQLFVDDGQARSAPAQVSIALGPGTTAVNRPLLGPVEFLAYPLSPVTFGTPYSSKELLQDTDAAAVARLGGGGRDGGGGGRSRFETRFPGERRAEPFSIEGNRGYVALLRRPIPGFVVSGREWPETARTLELREGLNLVAFPRGAPAGYDLGQLLDLTGSSFAAYTADRGGRTRIQIYWPAAGGPAPEVVPGQAYLLSVPSTHRVTLPTGP